MSEPPLNHSLLAPDSKIPTLKRLRQLARLLDKAFVIPGTNIGIGLDPIIGLLPGGGDFLGILLSAYIVLESSRLGASKATLSKMVWNIVIDSLIGTVPVFGDLFDFAWTANTRNITLLEDHLKFPGQNQAADKVFVALIFGGLLLASIVVVALTVVLYRFISSLLLGFLSMIFG
jgi:Domain of unknown function (DUF4112)